jgi:hypothetical protein
MKLRAQQARRLYNQMKLSSPGLKALKPDEAELTRLEGSKTR